MSQRVKLEGRQLLIDGKPCFVRSGEVHYFRAERRDWPRLVTAVREAGMNCLTSYIPWMWHESEEGVFDFGGERVAERDLGAFLDLAKDAGLHFFARIGPFVNAELLRGGHPLWLFDRHPELRSKDALGADARRNPDGDFVPSQLDPRYLQLVFRWFEHVIEVLKPYSIENGGPIVLMQVDNEPNLAFSYGIEGSLYDAHVLGRGGLWEQWLARTYGASVGTRYGLSAGDTVEPPRTGRTSTASEARLAADWLRFKKWHVFEFIRRLAEGVRERGLDLPFTMNEPINVYWPWNSGDHAAFARFMKETGVPMFTNGHCYLRYGGEQNLSGAPVTIARIESVKMSDLSGPPSIYELGSWFTEPSGALGSYNWDIMTKLLVGSGMNGYSVYVFNDGRAAPGFAKTGASYDWNTVIGHNGERNKPFEVLRDINAFVDCWQAEILGSEKFFDVTVGLSDEMPMIARHVSLPRDTAPSSVDSSKLSADVNANLTDLFRVLTHLSVNFELATLDHPNRAPGPESTGLLVVPNSGTLSAAAAGFVEAHLAAGGDALFYPLVPTFDSDGLPLERLAALCGQTIAGARARGGRVAGDLAQRPIDGEREREVALETPLVYFDVPAGATVLARHEGKPVAYRVAAGAGHATVVGLIPSFYTGAAQRLLDEVLIESGGVRRVACADNGSVFASVRGTRGGPMLVTAATIRGDEASTTLRVRAGGNEWVVPASGRLEMGAKEARFLWLSLPLPEAKLLYTTSQVVRGASAGQYLATGACGTAGQMAFDRPLNARVAGRARKMSRAGDAWVLDYVHTRAPLVVELQRP